MATGALLLAIVALLGLQAGLTGALLLLGLFGLRTQIRPFVNGELLRVLREIKSTGWRLEKRSWDLEAANQGAEPETNEPEAAA